MDYFILYHHHPEWKLDRTADQGCSYVLVPLNTGLRRSEALSLRREDIDYPNKVFTTKDPKTGIDHYLPMSKPIEEILQPQINDNPWTFPLRE